MLLATSLVAQDAPIPQQLPSPLRQNSDAVRRRVEQPIPQGVPVQQPTNDSFLNRLRATDRQTHVFKVGGNASPVEDRIAALEAKVEVLQKEVEAQKAAIKQLQERLDQQQKN